MCFILKFNKFLIWIILFIGVITVDLNYLQKDVQASTTGALLASKKRQSGYVKFKENFEVIPLSESISDETYARFKNLNKELEDNNSSTQYRIVTISGTYEETENNKYLFENYLEELKNDTGASESSDESNVVLIIFKDIPFVNISANTEISNKVLDNNLDYKIFENNYTPNYSEGTIFDELSNKFLDKAELVNESGILYNTKDVNNSDDSEGFDYSFLILVFASCIGVCVVLIFLIKNSDEYEESEDSDLKKVYNKYGNKELSGMLFYEEHDYKEVNSYNILNEDSKEDALEYSKLDTHKHLDDLLEIIDNGDISYLIYNIYTDPDQQDFKPYLAEFINKTNLDISEEHIDLNEVFSEFQAYFNEPKLTNEFIVRLLKEASHDLDFDSKSNLSSDIANSKSNFELEDTFDSSVEENKKSSDFQLEQENKDNNVLLNKDSDNELFKILKNRNLLPKGFKEYMFDKYKDHDFSKTSYFELLNIIDSELNSFNK